jgi:serine/threonine protein kinase
VGEVASHTPAATKLGSYEILGRLARGGMAEVFLARVVGPRGFEKLVVIKKILPRYARTPSFVRLFIEEAKIAASLDHPNVAQVHDLGSVDGNYFFVMEYVHGQNVRTLLHRTALAEKQFPIDHAVMIGRCVAAALHHAHERCGPNGRLLGIVHRDVSPSNIQISYDGAIKLVDFGVAKVASKSVQTRTGVLKGKISYLSPEQAKGEPIDRRSDVFALGIVLWEMVTTQRLFRGENDLATLQSIIHARPPPPSKSRPECSLDFERVILKALAADPVARYQTAHELELALEEVAWEQRLRQSPSALRTQMHELFDAEIAAWKEAQSTGGTSSSHVTAMIAVGTITRAANVDTGEHDADLDETAGGETVDGETDGETMDGDVGNETVVEDRSHQGLDFVPSQMEYADEVYGVIEEPEEPDVATSQVAVAPAVMLRPPPRVAQPIPSAIAEPVSQRIPSVMEPFASPFPVAPMEWRPQSDDVAIPERPALNVKPLVIAAILLLLFVMALAVAMATG